MQRWPESVPAKIAVMKRRHNIVVATILVFSIIFLFGREQDDMQVASRTGKSTDGPRHGQNSNTAPKQWENTLTDEKPPISSPPLENALPVEIPEFLPATPEPPSSPIVLPSGEQLENNDVPMLPLPELQTPPTEVQPETPHFEAEFPFQRDLELELPVSTLKELSLYRPHNYNPEGPKTYAYATFMATRNPSLKDPYFLAIHSLIYRILWAQRSRTQKYPFIVFVADFVTSEQRQLLAGAGALVRELAPLEWNPNIPGVQKRWKDLFAKLNMWRETEFERILFLDADAFPVVNIDDMFDIAPVQACEESKVQLDDFLIDQTPVCEPYVFAGVPQDPMKPIESDINVGSMVFTPSTRMHQRLLQNYVKTDKYDCLMAEQAFLSWQFQSGGAFPATLLERIWGGFFPKEDEEGKLKVVHEKLWVAADGWMKKEWEITWQEMLMIYASPDFLEARKQDGSLS